MEAALLAAIRMAPDGDDGPLRVYMDWLLERDDPRGRYLVLMLARDAPRYYSERWQQEIEPTEIAARAAWKARLDGVFTISAGEFEHGLPERVTFWDSFDELFAHADTLARFLRGVLVTVASHGEVLVRRDGRVLAQIDRSSPNSGSTYAQTVRVLALPSLRELAAREHDVPVGLRGAEGPWSRDLVFDTETDELYYDVGRTPWTLHFKPR
jgi:uncharacterized protein (TIGR02996 family)